MAIRVRKDGTMICAAHSEPSDGDTYIDDALQYEMSVTPAVILAKPMPDHESDPRRFWARAAPHDVDDWNGAARSR